MLYHQKLIFFKQKFKFQYQSMNNIEQDPLRFLKPRKKQFHLTPTKPAKHKKSEQSILTNSIHSVQSQFQQSNKLSKQVDSRQNIINKQPSTMNKRQPVFIHGFQNYPKPKQNMLGDIKNNNTRVYNSLKYFSPQIEDFLRKKRGLKGNTFMSPGQGRQESIQYFSEKTVNQNRSQRTIIKETTNIIQAVDQIQKRMNEEEDKFQNHSTYTESRRQGQENRHKNLQIIEQKVVKSKKQKETGFMEKESKRQFSQSREFYANNQEEAWNGDGQEEISQGDSGSELTPCPICSRKFNPNSYEKHVRVCEKVFYKKRKEFSSQKQRSVSRGKK